MNENDRAGNPKSAQQTQQPQPFVSPAFDQSRAGASAATNPIDLLKGQEDNPSAGDEDGSPHIDVARQNAKIQGLYKELLDEPLPDLIAALVKKLENEEGK